jgi:hypothetical protein
MREESTWGGNQELYAAARLFSVYIVIHQESTRMVIECDAQKPKGVIHIAYHGSDHYDSVRSLRDTDMNAPPMEIELAVDGFRPDDLKQVRTVRYLCGRAESFPADGACIAFSDGRHRNRPVSTMPLRCRQELPIRLPRATTTRRRHHWTTRRRTWTH